MDIFNSFLSVVMHVVMAVFMLLYLPVSWIWRLMAFVFVKPFRMENVKGKVVLITGASSGIGEAKEVKASARKPIVQSNVLLLEDLNKLLADKGVDVTFPIVDGAAEGAKGSFGDALQEDRLGMILEEGLINESDGGGSGIMRDDSDEGDVAGMILDLEKTTIVEPVAMVPLEIVEGEYIVVPAKPTNLRRFIDQMIVEKLSRGWPLEAYVKKMDEATERLAGNFNHMIGVATFLAEFKGRIEALEGLNSIIACHSQELSNLREDMCHSYHNYTIQNDEIRALQNDFTGLVDESTWTRNEIFKLFDETEQYRICHNMGHSDISAILEDLEETRRMDRLTRGTKNVAESNRLRMEGFQICVNNLVARGLFPRQLLNDQAFMDMVKDKDGLLLSLNYGDNLLRRFQGSPMGQHESQPPIRDHVSTREEEMTRETASKNDQQAM